MNWRLNEVLEHVRRNQPQVEWQDDIKTLSALRDFTDDAGNQRRGGRDGDSFEAPSPVAKKLVLSGLATIARGGFVDRGLSRQGEFTYPVFRPWDVGAKNPNDADGSFDRLLVRVRLLKDNVQILPALDLRSFDSFYLPFGVIRNVSHSIEGEQSEGNLPALLVLDPQ